MPFPILSLPPPTLSFLFQHPMPPLARTIIFITSCSPLSRALRKRNSTRTAKQAVDGGAEIGYPRAVISKQESMVDIRPAKEISGTFSCCYKLGSSSSRQGGRTFRRHLSASSLHSVKFLNLRVCIECKKLSS